MVSQNASGKIDPHTIDSIVKDVIDQYDLSGNAHKTATTAVIGDSMNTNDRDKLAKALEHSMITPTATPQMVDQFCDEAIRYGFVNVCVPSCYVKLAAERLRNSGVKTSSAVAFPFGNTTTRIKVEETLEIIEDGGVEIDLPINVGLFKSGNTQSVSHDIKSILEAAEDRALVKVVVDLGLLSEEEQIKVALIAKMSGAPFLKVAAGSKPGGVTPEIIRMIRTVIGDQMGIKADGGIRDQQTALKVLDAGANRIGASGSVKIITGA